MIREALSRCEDCKRVYKGPACSACNPDAEDPEIAARIAAARAAKRADMEAGGLGNVSPEALDAVLPPVDSAARTRQRVGGGGEAKGFESRRSRPPLNATKCLFCGRKLNAFDGRCHHCQEVNPGRADRAPVRVDAPRPASTGRVASIRNAAKGTPCPTCGAKRNEVNNRCYRCKPASLGRGGPVAARPKATPVAIAVPPTAVGDPELVAIAVPPTAVGDPELAAIAAALGAVAGLSGPARAYVLARLASGPEGGAS